MRVLDDEVLGVLFTEARTHRKWLDRPVDDATLRRVYELARWPPTSANSEPLRLVFVKSAASKDRLSPALDRGNVEPSGNRPSRPVPRSSPIVRRSVFDKYGARSTLCDCAWTGGTCRHTKETPPGRQIASASASTAATSRDDISPAEWRGMMLREWRRRRSWMRATRRRRS